MSDCALWSNTESWLSLWYLIFSSLYSKTLTFELILMEYLYYNWDWGNHCYRIGGHSSIWWEYLKGCWCWECYFVRLSSPNQEPKFSWTLINENCVKLNTSTWVLVYTYKQKPYCLIDVLIILEGRRRNR